MPLNLQQLQQQDDAWGKQYDAQQETQAEAQKPNAAEVLPTSVFHWMNQSGLGRATLSGIDTAVSTADSMYNSQPMRKARDVAAGAITGATNIEDAAQSGAQAASAAAAKSSDPVIQGAGDIGQALSNFEHPIWEHAKAHIMDFRDAMAVQDPTLADNLTQSVAQLALPFAGYSRMLSGLHGIADVVASGALTDSTALDAHAPRTADLIALGMHTEGKLGTALRALGPYGLNAYVNFLSDRSNESEAEGRFKNVLDGLTTNLAVTPLLHAAGIVLKQGSAGLRYMADNGVGSASGLGPPSLARQAGKIVFHGTAADFDQFDASKIGSGEGNQTYGHGLYFAENPGTARTYQQRLGGSLNSPAIQDGRRAIEQAGGDKVKAFTSLTDMANGEKDVGMRQRLNSAAGAIKSGAAERGGGRLMHVEIDDKHIGNMLDSDQDMSKQPDVLAKIPPGDQKQLERMLEDHHIDGELPDFSGNEFRQMVTRAINEGYIDHPLSTGNPSADASSYLAEHGIPGIKYLDNGSRGNKASGTRNIVLFNPKHATIVKKE